MSAPSLSLDAKDFQGAAKALERAGFEARAGRTVAYAIRRAINVVRRNVRAELRPHNKTGKMRDRVRVRYTGSGLDFVGGMKATGVAANLIVGGVGPHAIASDRPMPLWGGKGKSAAVAGFARAVSHPGFGPDPFVHRGIAKSEGDINTILEKAADTMVRELAYRMGGKS